MADTKHCTSPQTQEQQQALKGLVNAAKYREIVGDNLIQSARELRLGRRFIFQQDNDPTHTAEATQKWHEDSKLSFLASKPSPQSIDLKRHKLKKPNYIDIVIQWYCSELCAATVQTFLNAQIPENACLLSYNVFKTKH